ncbi:NAD-dependent epimerase [Camelimonas fluminis]|uniref:NAD-dependent epimerase n=1 Tax=Camelimonas fluminis TaxID=1576911 RepID=A0ABV7UDX3_9HYPH|nr:NAD-dependent epimerase [Camelimonas fluminis]GHE48028.1 NAD-dependent epimerase [Camelimonas fluminis]
MDSQETVLVTGAAGFIGFHLCQRLLAEGRRVVGLDTLNDYYDPALKRARLEQLTPSGNFSFSQTDIADAAALTDVFRAGKPAIVVNLAAQPGVRYSLLNPDAYTRSNLVGFQNLLECCRHNGVRHLVYASSSSVYGANRTMPFSVSQNVDHPLSLYAATKKANELSAHAYSHLFGLPTTGLRFFTVYGPWGRPDMATWLFAEAIATGKPLRLFNNGDLSRDFTYVDDIVEGVVRLLDRPARPDPQWSGAAPGPGSSSAPWRVYNIGANSPTAVPRLIALLEEGLGRKAQIVLEPMQPGDVPATWADTDALQAAIGYVPATPLETGVAHFVAWFRRWRNL